MKAEQSGFVMITDLRRRDNSFAVNEANCAGNLRLPAASVAVPGSSRSSCCSRMANIETAVPFGPQSPSNAASLTKQFTAVAVLMLNERGMLDLNAAIRSVLA